MTKIFIIEQGSYSDYRVVGIFSTREKAEVVLNYMKSHEKSYSDEAEIDEREIDPSIDAINQGLVHYVVTMNLETGDVIHIESISDPIIEQEDCVWDRLPSLVARYHGHCWAEDEKHAIKIINERRVQRIAQGGI